jgi:hypothetical protein
MLMRQHHFHYGLARSILVVLLLIGAVYVLTLYVPSFKFFIASRLGVESKVLGVSTESKNPQAQFKEDIVNNFNTIKKQPIKLEDVINTLSRSKLMLKDGEGIVKFLQDQAKTIKIPHAPKL